MFVCFGNPQTHKGKTLHKNKHSSEHLALFKCTEGLLSGMAELHRATADRAYCKPTALIFLLGFLRKRLQAQPQRAENRFLMSQTHQCLRDKNTNESERRAQRAEPATTQTFIKDNLLSGTDQASSEPTSATSDQAQPTPSHRESGAAPEAGQQNAPTAPPAQDPAQDPALTPRGRLTPFL